MARRHDARGVSWSCIGVVVALFAAFDGAAAWADAKISARCVLQADHTTRCQIRSLSTENSITPNIEARVDGRSKPVGGLERISRDALNSSDEIAVLFLVDGSGSMRRKALENIKSQIKSWIETAPSVFVFGVASFGTRVLPLADIGADKSALIEAIDKLDRKQKTTALHEVNVEAVNIVGQRGARRGFVVLMTDGLAEDNVITLSEVYDAARATDIAIFPIGYRPTTSTNGVTPHQALRLLARESGGVFIEADEQGTVPEPYDKRLLSLFDNGGTVSVDTSDESTEGTLELLVTMSDNTLASAEQKLRFSAPPTLMEQVTSYWHSGPTGKLVLAGSGLLSLLALMFAVRLMVTPKHREPPKSETTAASAETELAASTTGAPSAGLTYGFLDIMEGAGPPRRETITASSFRIGRAESNDLVLDNGTVSNDHAVLTIDQNNAFEIRDVHSANGTFVNGERVGRTFLNNGDRIELGRVAMKLVTLE